MAGALAKKVGQQIVIGEFVGKVGVFNYD